MKRILIIIISLAGTLQAEAFDWKSQNNEDLRRDMFAFIEKFMKETSDKKLTAELNEFLMAMKSRVHDEPYLWIQETNDFVDKMLEKYPAEISDGGSCSIERKGLLLLRDYPMHSDNYRDDATQELKDSYVMSIRRLYEDAEQDALKWLRKSGKSQRLEVCKTYNMGFFLRSDGHTVGIDLQWSGDKDEVAEVASLIDILFLSHPHDDHYSIDLMKAMLDAGKPVVMSYDIIPEYSSDMKMIVDKDKHDWVEAGGVRFISSLGHQGPEAPNNVYLISIGKWNVAQNGDNAMDEAEEFLGRHRVDVLITACWNNFKRTMNYIRSNPDGTSCIYIPAHENEWLHSVDHREAYQELFDRNDRFGDKSYEYFPSVIMDAAGDKFIFR